MLLKYVYEKLYKKSRNDKWPLGVVALHKISESSQIYEDMYVLTNIKRCFKELIAYLSSFARQQNSTVAHST